jgi:hypothetical protein
MCLPRLRGRAEIPSKNRCAITNIQILRLWFGIMLGSRRDESSIPRRKFSASEDDTLLQLVAKHGAYNWQQIARHLPGKTGRQCRDRFANYLVPTLSHEPWSTAEDFVLTQEFRQIGPRWAQIAACLPGRSSNAVKNRWRTQLRATYRGRSAKRTAAQAEPPKPPEAVPRGKPASTSSELFLSMILNPGVVHPACRCESLALVPNVQQIDIELHPGTVRPA